jgi:hypothetical protein
MRSYIVSIPPPCMTAKQWEKAGTPLDFDDWQAAGEPDE